MYSNGIYQPRFSPKRISNRSKGKNMQNHRLFTRYRV